MMQTRDHLRLSYRFWKALAVVLMLNFIAWSVGLLVLGGEAVHGRIENQRYYVVGRSGSTEVSREAYNYSLYHTYSVFVLGPLCVVAILVAKRKKAQL